jgi:hypothetical protein
MAGGNWDWTQNLTAAGEVQWPTGPLPLADPTEIPTSVVAWVVQRSNAPGANRVAGASQRTVQLPPFGPGRWAADGGVVRQGTFVPGPALGIALAQGYIPGVGGAPDVDTFYWWADPILLV